MQEEAKSTEQPSLELFDAKAAELEDILDLFRDLTGREPTPEEVEEAKQAWKGE